MNQYPVLLKREFWEHRNIFVVLPVITAGFFIFLMLAAFTAFDVVGIKADMSFQNEESSEHYTIDSDDMTMDEAIGVAFARFAGLAEEQREQGLYQVLYGLGMPFLGMLTLVIFFYLMGSLYEDRKDRSILFWKSLPVSDINTVLVKLLTATILVPAVYLVCIAAVHLAMLLIITLAAIGHDFEIWAMLWQPANLIAHWLSLIALTLVQSLWSLPFFGWILLVSAYARSVPLAWIIGIPIVIAALEGMLLQDRDFVQWFTTHASPVIVFGRENLSLADIPSRVLTIDMLVSVVIAILLVAAAIWLRGKADEI